MKAIIFGATGMVGQGALRECLRDPEVKQVLVVARRTTGVAHPKLREIIHADFLDFSGIESQLSGYDACLFCLGVSSAGMSEDDYRRVTYDVAIAAAETLVKQNPAMTFVFVSGAGTDSTEKGRSMWARVKGQTENALLRLPFKAAYMFRPAYIQPLHGSVSTHTWVRVFYAVLGWLYPMLKRVIPKYVTTTEDLGRVMLIVAKHGADARILESADIVRIAAAAKR